MTIRYREKYFISIMVKIMMATTLYGVRKMLDCFHGRKGGFMGIDSKILFWVRSKVNSFKEVCDSPINRSLSWSWGFSDITF
jgi:hypothetical protein